MTDMFYKYKHLLDCIYVYIDKYIYVLIIFFF